MGMKTAYVIMATTLRTDMDFLKMKDIMIAHEIGSLNPELSITLKANQTWFRILIMKEFENEFHWNKIYSDIELHGINIPLRKIFENFLDECLHRYKLNEVGEA